MKTSDARPKNGEATPQEHHWVRDLRNSFFAGLLVIVPVAASVGILFWMFNTVTGWLVPPALRQADGTVPFQYRVVALAVFVVLTTGLGWITRLMIGRELVKLTESVMLRIPILNKIYRFAKDVSDTMFSGKKTVFERVVLVEYPRPGVYALGFVTNETQGEAQVKTREPVISVFIPTTPNPTSGFLALVPRDKAIPMEMSVADGMKFVISGGSVVPPYVPKRAEPLN